MEPLFANSPAAQWAQLAFVLVVFVFAAMEYRHRQRAGMGYDLGALSGTLGVAAGQVVTKALSGGMVAAMLMGIYALAPFPIAINDWKSWAIGFLVLEFFYYWQHRFSHTIRWYWASHAVHHSPQQFTLPAALRLSWTGAISGNWVYFAPMALMGFHPLMIGGLLAINLSYQYFLHTELVGKLGPLEWVFNTPSHHRVHHGSNPDYLDRNFGGVLIVFDRLFGTFAEERAEEPVRYGLTRPMTSTNPFVIAFHEWGRMIEDLGRAKSWRDVWTIVCGRPGAPLPSARTRPVLRRAAKGLPETTV